MQADLFNLSMSNSFERQAFQRSFFEKKYTLRLDQLLALGLVTIVFFVLVFAWGVEHGKVVAHREHARQTQQAYSEFNSERPSSASKPQQPKALAQPIVAPSVEVASSEIAEDYVNVEKKVAPISKPAIAVASKYTIAHMTYVKRDQAMKELSRIKAKGFQAFLVPSGKYFQICVNGFESRKEANDAIKNLRINGIVSTDSYIRNMPAGR